MEVSRASSASAIPRCPRGHVPGSHEPGPRGIGRPRRRRQRLHPAL